MARRPDLVRRHDEDLRRRIQVSNIIHRLHRHLDGEEELSVTRIKAAEILLKKALPDLAQVTHKGDDNAPIKHVFSWGLPEKPQS